MKTVVLAIIIAFTFAVLTAATPPGAGDAAAGKAVYTKKCASCHGPNGEGKDAVAKMLKVELKDLGSKQVQGKSDAQLIKDTKEGIGKMKPVADLKDKDLQDVVSFVRTLAKK